MVAPAPLDPAEFGALIERLGPWPARPALAVALSGGRDSLALTLLLQEWLAQRNGRLLALTVDHDLRPGAAADAAWVADLCRSRGIAQRTLLWHHDPLPPGAPVQAAARQARYRLLQQACRAEGLAVLCTAHQADDQRETFVLRLLAGSGPLGLAGMTARGRLDDVALLRPLLGVPRERLAATLRQRQQPWLDDPSNENRRHRRVAVRESLPGLAAVGLTGERLDAAAALLGRLRLCLERTAATLLAQVLSWHPAGFARLDLALAVAPRPVARLALAEVVRTLGAAGNPPGEAALDRALDRLAAESGRGFTLGGVRFLRRGKAWLAFPEARSLPVVPLQPGLGLRWGCFAAEVDAGAPEGLHLQALGQAAWPALARDLGRAPLPGPVLWVQPALHDAEGLLAVPTLGWRRRPDATKALQLHFIPEAPTGGFGFTVAWRERHII